MEQPIPKSPRMSVQQYLELEQTSQVRHEFYSGERVMMAGGTWNHSRIKMNFAGLLVSKLRGQRCQAADSDMRVSVNPSRYFYPDLSIVCGPPEFDPVDRRKTTILNPTVVIEVLSDSSASFDRGEKFAAYRDMPSLREYVLVSQYEAIVEVFLRQDDGSWRFDTYKGADAIAKLRSVEIELKLSDIYEAVTFEPRELPADMFKHPREQN